MNKLKYYKFLSQDISLLKGVGKKITNLLKRKKIEKVSDLLWNLPQSFIDRSNLTSLDVLEVGKITTIKVEKKVRTMEIMAMIVMIIMEVATGIIIRAIIITIYM